MQVRPLDAVARLLAERPARAGRTRVCAIDGPSGSGKTTLARRLAPILDATLLHMDDIYPGWDGLAHAPDLLVGGVLRPLAEARPASFRRWDWERDRWTRTETVSPVPVLLVEGVGCGALACAPYLSLLAWVEAPAEVRMSRGIDRDGEAYRPHWQRWAAQENQMFSADRTRDRADLRVDGAPAVSFDERSEFVGTAP